MERRFVIDSLTEVRAEGNKIVGYASVFYRKDDPGTQYQLWDKIYERIDRKAFNRAISENHDVRALFNHDPNYLLGRSKSGTLNLSVDNKGLRYEITFDPNDPQVQSVRAKIERGDLSGSSFAFVVRGESWAVDGDNEIRTITDLDLFDVGPVTYPAYGSSTAGVRSMDCNEARTSYNNFKRKLETEKRIALIKRK